MMMAIAENAQEKRKKAALSRYEKNMNFLN